MTHQNIAVIGCGYIGSETAHVWKNKGHRVTGTTRHPERLQEIAKYAQESVLIQGQRQEFRDLISENDVLLISVAADNRDEYETTYLQIARDFRTLALEMGVARRLIYTSSTSVYGDAGGQWVDEESVLLTPSPQGKILIQTEQIYQSLEELGWHVTILRFAEIYGPGREISNRLKKISSSFPGTGMQYTNMVHKADCASAIDYALQHKLRGTYNVADDDHPTRKELYAKVADQFHLTVPQWDPSRSSIHGGNKRISNHKIKSAGFSLKFPHRHLE